MAKRPTRKRPSRRRKVTQPQAEPSQSPTRRATRWVWTAVLAGLAALIGAAVLALPNLLTDVPALQDEIRPGDDIRMTVHERGWEYSYSLAMPTVHEITPEQQGLMSDLAGSRDGQSNLQILYQQLLEAGGVPLGMRQLAITLEGRRSQTIQILGISPELTEQPAPGLSGTVFDIPPQDVGIPQRIGFDMDEPARTAREVGEGSPPQFGQPYFTSNVITLPTNDREQVILMFKADRYAYSFRIKIEYLIGDDQRTATVDDDGHPFRITGYHCDSSSNSVTYPAVYFYGDGPTELVPVESHSHFEWVSCD